MIYPCDEPPGRGRAQFAEFALARRSAHHARIVTFIHSRIWARGKRTTRFRRRIGIPSFSQRRMVRTEILSTVANSLAVRKSAFGADVVAGKVAELPLVGCCFIEVYMVGLSCFCA